MAIKGLTAGYSKGNLAQLHIAVVRLDRWVFRGDDLHDAYNTTQIFSDNYSRGIHCHLPNWHGGRVLASGAGASRRARPALFRLHAAGTNTASTKAVAPGLAVDPEAAARSADEACPASANERCHLIAYSGNVDRSRWSRMTGSTTLRWRFFTVPLCFPLRFLRNITFP